MADNLSQVSEQNGVPSPCKSLCKLDGQKICQGCYRTSSEISFWTTMSNEEKLDVIEKAKQREQARGNTQVS